MKNEIKKVFLYGEIQFNGKNFSPKIWKPVNERLKTIPGLIRKTWLIGISTNTLGGLYEFDSVENALAFGSGPYQEEAHGLGAGVTYKIFDGEIGESPSRDMLSPHYN